MQGFCDHLHFLLNFSSIVGKIFSFSAGESHQLAHGYVNADDVIALAITFSS